MANISQAIEYAAPIWQQAVVQLSWWHGLMAGAYGVAAWLCYLNGRFANEVMGSCLMWCAAATLMCMLGVNVLLQGDVFVTQMCRALAKFQGWYEYRRELQYTVVGLIALMVPGLGWLLFQRMAQLAQGDSGLASGGLLVLLVLIAVRMVSAHGTDVLINMRLAGFSVGRLLELVGLAAVIVGALRSLSQPSFATNTYPTGMGRHV